MPKIETLYRKKRPSETGKWLGKHMDAMTTEDLNSKGDIATELAARDMEIDRLRKALSIVADWSLPDTGKRWEDGEPMSYGACYGSNGERDYMKDVAAFALGRITIGYDQSAGCDYWVKAEIDNETGILSIVYQAHSGCC